MSTNEFRAGGADSDDLKKELTAEIEKLESVRQATKPKCRSREAN